MLTGLLVFKTLRRKKSTQASFANSMNNGNQTQKKTFDVFRESWTGFCERNNYERKETTAESGAQFLQAERARHLEAGHKNPGVNVRKSFAQFKKLRCMQGRPKLEETEHAYMQNVVCMAENDGAEAAIHRPVDENQKQLDRTTLTSHDVEQLLSVNASMPDRLQAARAGELILLNIQTGGSLASQQHLQLLQGLREQQQAVLAQVLQCRREL